MREIKDDRFYETIKEYDRLVIDYCLIESDVPYQGFPSHKDAVMFAILKLKEEYPWITTDIDKAKAEEITADILLQYPDKPWKENRFGTTLYHTGFSAGGKIAYWYAFLAPPHGTSSVVRNGKTVRKEYGIEDFELVNHALFPKGSDGLHVYEWSTDWSDYFDEGHEWWGTACYSVYDEKTDRYAVIMASATD